MPCEEAFRLVLSYPVMDGHAGVSEGVSTTTAHILALPCPAQPRPSTQPSTQPSLLQARLSLGFLGTHRQRTLLPRHQETSTTTVDCTTTSPTATATSQRHVITYLSLSLISRGIGISECQRHGAPPCHPPALDHGRWMWMWMWIARGPTSFFGLLNLVVYRQLVLCRGATTLCVVCSLAAAFFFWVSPTSTSLLRQIKPV
ncbi:hypothetical protein CPB84DRAFT_278428 [Gymnopilus junonius]|uniref:Uncharacterized protein n=1 Tax=Gymnopilus junonius TaxID=109634 RepID=A0A9P5NFA5_GYMJU|nr:hypothetical protein CPB84DRAFT_278428 [Gymnopilus junonius]